SALERELNERNRLDRNRPTDTLLSVARGQRTPAALFDELNWDYATIERLNPDLTTRVIPFNLGSAVLQGDETNNIALAPGDVVTVYSQKDVRVPVARQTRLVSLEGEINAPGIYQLQPGETLKQLLGRAGGFTPQAYVYGLELSREETRARQRENLQTAISRLEALSAVQAARDAANRRDDDGRRQQYGDAGAAVATVANPAERPDRARADARHPHDRCAARPSARERRPHQRAAAAGLRHRRRRGRQQQRVRLEARADRGRLPAPRRRRRGRRHRQHVHPARRRHRQHRGRPARLLRPRRPRSAGAATRRRPRRSEPARLRDLGPRARPQPQGLRADLLGVRHRHRRDPLAQPVAMLSADSTTPQAALQALYETEEDEAPAVSLTEVLTWLGESKRQIAA